MNDEKWIWPDEDDNDLASMSNDMKIELTKKQLEAFGEKWKEEHMWIFDDLNPKEDQKIIDNLYDLFYNPKSNSLNMISYKIKIKIIAEEIKELEKKRIVHCAW